MNHLCQTSDPSIPTSGARQGVLANSKLAAVASQKARGSWITFSLFLEGALTSLPTQGCLWLPGLALFLEPPHKR